VAGVPQTFETVLRFCSLFDDIMHSITINKNK
jgi:hypothetical protein